MGSSHVRLNGQAGTRSWHFSTRVELLYESRLGLASHSGWKISAFGLRDAVAFVTRGGEFALFVGRQAKTGQLVSARF
ncbi:MAG: hypothetical protein CMJ75_11085 [Planctomycetaceae bacterium]|nr:hypothetical protein [Planctomycetaceae bacterium]